MSYLLYENVKEQGWVDGGLFAKLQGAPELGADDFTIVWLTLEVEVQLLHLYGSTRSMSW